MRAPLFLSAFLITALTTSVTVAQFLSPPWRVNALPGQGNFEVIQNLGGDNSRFWCEAGNYALRYQGQGVTDRIYILHPYGRAQTQSKAWSVGFTVAPNPDVLAMASRPGDGGNYSLSVKKVGFNISVGNARGLCVVEIPERF